jgi:hypothetical protein
MRSALLLLLLGVTTCAGAESARNWGGSVETLANGAVRVSNPPQGLWSERSAWRLVPEVVIGEIDGAAEYAFGAIVGLEVDDAGRIYVVDRQANQVRTFEPDGRHVRTVGREGGGPGEYRNANGIGWLASPGPRRRKSWCAIWWIRGLGNCERAGCRVGGRSRSL